MKLVKLSLAAAVAAGALTSVASALPLEEAIKNVDLSGYGRYRYTSDKEKTDETVASTKHNFKAELKLKSDFDDNFFGNLGLRYGSTDLGTVPDKNDDDYEKIKDSYQTDTKSTFNVQEIYLGYKAGNTTILAGRQVLGTFFTDDMAGDGIKILNNDIAGLTLAAIAFDNLEKDGDIGTKDLNTYQNKLYGVAAIGSFDPVSFQVWGAKLQNVAALFAADVAGNVELSEDISINLHGQAGFSKVESKVNGKIKEANDAIDKKIAKGEATKADKLLNKGDGKFFGIEAGFEAFGAELTAGYVNYGTSKDKLTVISYEDQGEFIDPFKLIFQDHSLTKGKSSFWFAEVGYKIDDAIKLGLVYGAGTNKYETKDAAGKADTSTKVKSSELTAKATYNYSKKLRFSTFWAHAVDKTSVKSSAPTADTKKTTDRIRFEARYSF